jgi:hypothetical protein
VAQLLALEGDHGRRQQGQDVGQLLVFALERTLGLLKLIDVEVGPKPEPGAAGGLGLLQRFGHALGGKPAVAAIGPAQPELVAPGAPLGQGRPVFAGHGGQVVGVNELGPEHVDGPVGREAGVGIPLRAEVLHPPGRVGGEGGVGQAFGYAQQALGGGLGLGAGRTQGLGALRYPRF